MECSMNSDKAALMENPLMASEASLKEARNTDKIAALTGNNESAIFPRTNIHGFSRRGLK